MRFGSTTDIAVIFLLGLMVGYAICFGVNAVPQVLRKETILEFSEKNWAQYTDRLERACNFP